MLENVLGVEIHRDLWYNIPMADFHEKLVEIYEAFAPARDLKVTIEMLTQLQWDEAEHVVMMAMKELRSGRELSPQDTAMIASLREIRRNVTLAIAIQTPEETVQESLSLAAKGVAQHVTQVLEENDALGSTDKLAAMCAEVDSQMNILKQPITKEILDDTDWTLPQNMLRILFCRARRGLPFDDRLITWVNHLHDRIHACEDFVLDALHALPSGADIEKQEYSAILSNIDFCFSLMTQIAKHVPAVKE